MTDWLKRFRKCARANVAVTTAMLAMPLFAAGGMSIDYAYMYQLESSLQNAVDSAALATVKELRLTDSDPEAVTTVAKNYVFATLTGKADEKNTRVHARVSDDRMKITVSIAHVWKPFFLHYVTDKALPLKASATATLAGKGAICMIGLEEKKPNTILLTKRARLEATGCGVYSNSTHGKSITVEKEGGLVTGVTCTAGGFKGVKRASFDPMPITDCPRVADPLADRPRPSVGSCDHKGFAVKSGSHTLYPGTYCEGLKIKGTAQVRLMPGVYVIRGDKLEVTDKAVLEGKNVGFYLNGHKAKLSFKKQTTISLTAPKDGVLAGILVFEDRDASSKVAKHQITSDNARLLLGTIYLPNGTLRIDSERPVSDKSAYTAIIARQVELDEGPTLYLNSDFDATDVPVPEGLVKDRAYLTK